MTSTLIWIGVVLFTVGTSFWAGHHWEYLEWQASLTESANVAASTHAASQKAADAAGSHVEAANTAYHDKTKGIAHASIDSKCNFTADRVRPLASVNAAGKASRQLADPVR